jgi:predicted DNA-binding transcriptional regulator YafY
VPDDTVNIRLKNTIEILKSNSQISTLGLAKKLNVSRITAVRDLNKLKEWERIIRLGSDKAGYWKIVENED